MSMQEVQHAFYQHIRDPDNVPLPKGIEDRRMAVYRELFFNNVCGFIDNAFPVLKSLYCERDWRILCREFFVDHSCRSPHFAEISKEFVEFLSSEYKLKDIDPVFMAELAHYEWIELDVSIAFTTRELEEWDGKTEITAVTLSDTARLLSYQYPVHQISADFRPQAADGPYFFVVSRDLHDEVTFTQINQVNAFMLNMLVEHEALSLATIFDALTQALPQLPEEQVVQGATETIKNMLQQQILMPIA